MKTMRSKNRQKGTSFIGILVTVVILALLYMMVIKKYLANPMSQDKESQKALEGQGIVVKNLPDAVAKAQEAVDKANKANNNIEAQSAPPGE